MTNSLPKLARLTKVPLREVWSNEAAIFTPWLELPENLDLLAEALGLPALQPHRREQAVGRYSADLVCAIEDTSDYLLIENQIQISDHKHLGQLMTYISGLEGQGLPVRYVAWLAEDFTDEHRDAIEWLNSQLDERIGFFACRIEAWQIGTSEKAPRFDVIVQPRQLTLTPSAQTRLSEPQGIDINRVAYWGAFSEEIRRRGLPLKLRSEPPRMGFYSFTLNASLGIYLYAYRQVSTEEIGAYVNFGSAPAPVPRLAYDILVAEKPEIEHEYGAALRWQEVKPDKNYRILAEPFRADVLDEQDWPRQHKWLVDQIEKLYRIFEPRVRNMPTREKLLNSSDSSVLPQAKDAKVYGS